LENEMKKLKPIENSEASQNAFNDNLITGVFNQRSKPLDTTIILNHPVHIVEAHNPQSLALLKQAYDGVYTTAFPIDEERESLSSWDKHLHGGNPALNIVIAISGTHLDTETPAISGISVGYYYKNQDVGLLAYVAIDPQYRNAGLGRVMVEARKQAILQAAEKNGKELQGVFIECNDPAKVSPEQDSFDPATRLKIFQKWGARITNMNYIQPPLEAGGEKCDFLKLLAYPHPKTGEYPAKEGIKGFLNGIYTVMAEYNGCAPEQSADYLNSIEELKGLSDHKLYIHPEESPPLNLPVRKI
jgi:GNAT superfamily N-acetyltransferase